jgi:hypothetical protein
MGSSSTQQSPQKEEKNCSFCTHKQLSFYSCVCILRYLQHGKNPRALCPPSGPPLKRTHKYKNLTRSTINHKGVLDLTDWLMFQTNNKVGTCTCLPTKKNPQCSGTRLRSYQINLVFDTNIDTHL